MTSGVSTCGPVESRTTVLVADYLSVVGYKVAGVTACIVLLRDPVPWGLCLVFKGIHMDARIKGFAAELWPVAR